MAESEQPSGAPANPAADAPADENLGFVSDVPIRISVEVGSARLLVRDVLQLTEGSVVELDRSADAPADLYVNGRLIGRGDITVVDDRVAIKIVDLSAKDERPPSS